MKTLATTKLINSISQVRLDAYGNNSNEKLLDEYIYNIRISEALYPILAILEVTLRNNISNAIDKFICKNWLYLELQKQNILSDKEYKKLSEAADKIRKAKKAITNDRLISEMTFGFWVHLFTKSYKPKLWDKKNFFEEVFPNYKADGKLRSIYPIQNKLLEILKLRNRIFHYEIVINASKSIQEQYQNMLNLLYLLSPAMVEFLSVMDRFPNIVKLKP